ncbi:MAG: AAA family ATPase [Desulfurococcales archaeon]|nr:AAA family ATPase [Desulfurococcales archaeon]
MYRVPGKFDQAECNGRGRKPIVVISGPPGSGKTTYSKRLAQDLNLPYHSAGQIFREIASSKGLRLDEMSRLAEKDPSIDLLIDETTMKRATRCGGVIEGHLTAWVLKDIADVSIFLNAPLDVRLGRISGREKNDVIEETISREESQYHRYLKFYGIDVNIYSGFDMVIDTSKASIEEVYRTIRVFVESVLKRKGWKV